MQETGVAGLSGDCFGRSPDELTMRLYFVDFYGAKLFDDIGIENIENIDEIGIDHLVNKFPKICICECRLEFHSSKTLVFSKHEFCDLR